MWRLDLFRYDIGCELFLDHAQKVQFGRSVRVEEARRDVEPEWDDDLR